MTQMKKKYTGNGSKNTTNLREHIIFIRSTYLWAMGNFYFSYGNCYVINYALETGQPCYRLQIRNVQGYNEQVVASTRFTMRTTRNADRS
jgi:hypothetical protein